MQLNAAFTHFESLPQEYVDLVREATEIEVKHHNGQYIRVWGPMGCIEMDEGYGIRQRILDAMTEVDIFYFMHTEAKGTVSIMLDTAISTGTTRFGLRRLWMIC